MPLPTLSAFIISTFLSEHVVSAVVGITGGLLTLGTKYLFHLRASRRIGLDERSKEREYVESEWEALTKAREYLDKRIEDLARENIELRERVRELEDKVDRLSDQLLTSERERLKLQQDNIDLLRSSKRGNSPQLRATK